MIHLSHPVRFEPSGYSIAHAQLFHESRNILFYVSPGRAISLHNPSFHFLLTISAYLASAMLEVVAVGYVSTPMNVTVYWFMFERGGMVFSRQASHSNTTHKSYSNRYAGFHERSQSRTDYAQITFPADEDRPGGINRFFIESRRRRHGEVSFWKNKSVAVVDEEAHVAAWREQWHDSKVT